MGDRHRKAALFDQLARVGKALGNGRRLELLDLLTQSERSVEQLASAAGLGLSTASAHLQVLKHAGLVTTRREGTTIHYDLAGADVARLYAALRDVAGARIADVERARAAYLGLDSAGLDSPPPELSRGETRTLAAAGEIVLLDVRPAQEYAAAHIPGALSIPLEELPERIGEVPTGQQVVVYCRGAYCAMAHEAVDLLRRHGHRARRLHEGLLEWRLADLPVDSGPD